MAFQQNHTKGGRNNSQWLCIKPDRKTASKVTQTFDYALKESA